jgi:DNA-binding response OmpR family regulator
MQTSDELAALLREAASHGRIVIIPATAQHNESSLVTTCRLLFKLTGAESRALAQLLKHPHVSKAQLHVAVSRDDPPITNIRILDSVIHRLRKKLAPHGIEIINLHGFGYSIPEDIRSKAHKLLAEYSRDVLATTSRGEETLNE